MNLSIFLILRTACLALLIFGLVLAYIELKTYKNIKTVGYIVINKTDPEKDVYSLELNVPFGELDKHDRVLFEIKHE